MMMMVHCRTKVFLHVQTRRRKSESWLALDANIRLILSILCVAGRVGSSSRLILSIFEKRCSYNGYQENVNSETMEALLC